MSIEVRRLHWVGRADGVAVKTFMPRFPDHLPMRRLDDDRWSVDLHIPADARIEYRFEIRRGDRYQSTLDPSNVEVATNPFGENSVLTGSAYPVTAALPSPIAWRHVEFRVQSSAFRGRRHHHLLAPGGVADSEPLPLFVLHDGGDYRRHGNLDTRLGSAIASGALPPLRVALLDPRRRNDEYIADPHHADHVATEVIPHLASRIGLNAQRVIGGTSLGAVAAWHTAWRHPGAASGLVLQSGTFPLSPPSELPVAMAAPIRRFLSSALTGPPLSDIRVGQTCGRYESLIDWNRTVAEYFSSVSAAHSYEERWTGHDWGAWSDMLVSALAAALRA